MSALATPDVDPMTPRKLEDLRAMTRISWRGDRRKLATYERFFDEQLAALKVAAAPPAVPTVVFRPVHGDPCRWAMGYADDVRVLGFKYGRRAIEAAYKAISGAAPVLAPDYVRSGARAPQNALRDALHGRVPDEIETRTGCTPLAAAIRSIRVSRRTGLVEYTPTDDVRILSNLCAQF